jgi:hypothetical protein
MNHISINHSIAIILVLYLKRFWITSILIWLISCNWLYVFYLYKSHPVVVDYAHTETSAGRLRHQAAGPQHKRNWGCISLSIMIYVCVCVCAFHYPLWYIYTYIYIYISVSMRPSWNVTNVVHVRAKTKKQIMINIKCTHPNAMARLRTPPLSNGLEKVPSGYCR